MNPPATSRAGNLADAGLRPCVSGLFIQLTMTAESTKYRVWKMSQSMTITAEQVRKHFKCAAPTAQVMLYELVAEKHIYVSGKEPCRGGSRNIFKAVEGSIGPMRYTNGNHNPENAGHPSYTGMPAQYKKSKQPIIPFGVGVDKALNAFLGIRA